MRGAPLRLLAFGLLVPLGAFTLGACTHYRVVEDGELNPPALRRVEERTTDVRGLPFKEPVEAEVYNKQKSGKFFEGESKPDPEAEERARREDVVAHRMGMLPDGVSLRDLFKKALTNNAAGVYQPPKDDGEAPKAEQKQSRGRLFIVQDALPRPVRAVVGGFGYLTGTDWANELFLSHELMHALQDQHFDLNRVLPRRLYGECEDMAIARKSVVESEANLVSQAYLLGVDLDSVVQRNALIEYLAFGRIVDTWTTRLMNPGLPPFYVKVLVEQYTQGMRFLQHVTNRGGWEAVNRAYATSLPLSTEQLMDPDKLFGPEPDMPRYLPRIDAGAVPPSLEGWSLLEENVLGALLWRIYLEDYVGGADAITEGWGGDRYEVLEKDGRSLLVWRTLWDTDDDATEFAAAYAEVLQAKYPGRVTLHERDEGTTAWKIAPKEAETGSPGVRTATPEIAVIAQEGDRVLVLEGAPPDSWRKLRADLMRKVYEDPSAGPTLPAPPPVDEEIIAFAKEQPAPLRERVFLPHHRMVFRLGLGASFDHASRPGAVSIGLIPDREFRWGFRQGLEWTPPYLLSLALLDRPGAQTVVTSGFADVTLGFADAGFYLHLQPVLIMTQAFHIGAATLPKRGRLAGWGSGLSFTGLVQAGVEGDARTDGLTLPQVSVLGGGALLVGVGDRLVLSAGVGYRSGYEVAHPLAVPELVDPTLTLGAATSRGRTAQPTVELRLYDGLNLYEASQVFVDPVGLKFLGHRHVMGLMLYF
jgi:hypothetical protein